MALTTKDSPGFSPERTGDPTFDRVQDKLKTVLDGLRASAQKRVEGSAALTAGEVTAGGGTATGKVPAMKAARVTFTVSDSASLRGLSSGMAVSVTSPTALPAGLSMSARVPSADTLEVTINNPTGTDIAPPFGRYAFVGVANG